MTSHSEAIKVLLLCLVLLSTGFAAGKVLARDKVKYCRNAKTGQIIAVGAGRPCPYPTHEL